jgi:hypothetical protein
VSERIIAALQAARPDDDDLDGAVVIGFAAVAEWMTPSGERWISLETGDASGADLQRWQVQGYFFNVLHDPAWQPEQGHEDDAGD